MPASTRLVASLVLGLALLSVVAASSGAMEFSDSSRIRVGSWPASAGGAVLLAGIVLAVGFSLYSFARWAPSRSKQNGGWREEAIAIAILAVLALAYFAYTQVAKDDRRVPTPVARPSTQSTPVTASSGASEDTANQGVDWWLVGLLIGTTCTFGGLASWAIVRQRQRVGLLPDQEPGSEIVAAAAMVSLEAVLREPDPRRAVILAYQRMEGALAEAGIARRSWETPFEYLDRVFVELGAPAGVAVTLTELYERAKFGHHEINGVMRNEALAALTRLAEDLRVTA